MAKNKNRKQATPHSRSSQPDETQERTQRPASDTHQSPISQVQGNPSDVARKQQKRFGHN
ncbi:hypothetical protein ABZ845_01125 [Streptomyces sp. NPDC047022]|uniref:hypothetical protein n=1 Tax=Streptomyces sp. NPDC047022 TaxID=3155737 RepID=UPI0033EE6003